MYKPSGPTSFDMVWKVKSLLGVKKAGHLGTLDPLAEGVLPICLDRATKIIQFLSSVPKVYRAVLELGAATDTQDATGKVVARGNADPVTEEAVRTVLGRFPGKQNQVPPMFSAKKKKGIPLYKLARNGITIDRKPVSIFIHSLEFLKKEGNRVEFEVKCSAGTYVRTLCHDIGSILGCEAHLVELVRTQAGLFDLNSSLTLKELETAQADGTLVGKLVSLEKALDFLPEIRVKKSFVHSIANGVALSKSSLESVPRQFQPGMNLRVSNGNHNLLAIVEPVVDQDHFARLAPGDVVFKLKRVLV